MHTLRFLKAWVMLLVLMAPCRSSQATFTEDLVLEPLSDGKVIATFQFKHGISVNTSDPSSDHYVFPRTASELLRPGNIESLHLAFTQGSWDPHNWGLPLLDTNPTGVELWARFISEHHIDAQWRALTSILAGIFCASLNFMKADVTCAPRFALPGRKEGGRKGKGQSIYL